MTTELKLDKPDLDKAYAVCKAIAKSKAKNFYYAFVALPVARRNAICAIYAFMRMTWPTRMIPCRVRSDFAG